MTEKIAPSFIKDPAKWGILTGKREYVIFIRLESLSFQIPDET
jgi:hypothetical protein